MKDKDEFAILSYLKEHIDDARCFKPIDILGNLVNPGSKLDHEEKVATVCRRLHAKNLIIPITTISSDPNALKSCYRITEQGLDKLNPNSREKKMYKLTIITTIAAIIAAVASIIAIFSS